MRLDLLLLLTVFLTAACDAPSAPRRFAAVAASTDSATEAKSEGPAWTPVGLEIGEVPEAALKALGVAYGVMVTKVRAPADRSRILPGDVIVGVNQTQIRSVEEFNSLLADQSHGTLGLLVRRVDADLYIPLGNPEENKALRRPARDRPLRT